MNLVKNLKYHLGTRGAKQALAYLSIAILMSLAGAGYSPADEAQRRPEPPSSLRQFIGLIEYIRGDYPEAVKDGKVVNPGEFREMSDFVAAAERLFQGLAPELGPTERTSLQNKLAQLAGLIASQASYPEILAVTSGIKQESIAAFHLPVGPERAPDWQLGASTYAEHCASCHGETGHGDGPAGVGLEPSPRNFHEAGVMGVSSPFKFYNTLLTGIDGTAMVSYKSLLSADALWSVSFYLSSLRHAPKLEGDQTSNAANPAELAPQITPQLQQAWLAAGLSLESLAAKSDDELRAWVHQKDATADAERSLSLLRSGAPFLGFLPLQVSSETRAASGGRGQEINEGVAYALAQIEQAKQSFKGGIYAEAERFLLDAYLYGFEKTEVSLSIIDPSLSSQVERLFMEARGYARQQDAEKFAAAVSGLQEAILHAKARYEAHHNDSTAGGYWGEFISSFVIIVREGFEAFLVIAALLALLSNMGEARAKRWVHAGWLIALVAGGLTYIVFNWVLMLSGFAKESMEAICTGVAVVLLFYTGFWLLSQSEKHKWDQYIKTKTKTALSSGRLWSIFFIAFIAVYREAAETVLFYAALFSTARSPMLITAGFGVGCLVLLAICGGIIRFNLRLPLRQFFMVTSCLMVAISVVLAGKTVHELVEAGFLHATPLSGVPAIDLLGIYPSMETLAVQGVLLIFGAILAYVLLRRKKDVRSVS